MGFNSGFKGLNTGADHTMDKVVTASVLPASVLTASVLPADTVF